MELTVKDILKIKPGASRTFRLENANKVYSARAIVSYVRRTKQPAGISRYKTHADWESNSITITAVGE